MFQRTVEMLLSDLTEAVNIADPERYRTRVLDHVRTVFRRIGYDLVAQPYVEQLEVKNHQLVLPPYVLDVEDVGDDGETWCGFEIGGDMYALSYLAYRKSPYGLHFPNLTNYRVYVRFLGLPVDDDNQALIPAETYEAVYEYTLGKLLEGLYQHPRYAERYTILQNSYQLIAESRVALMGDSAARHRTERRVLGNMKPRYVNSGFWNR